MPNLCKDCKHYEKHLGWDDDVCRHERGMRDLVRGTTRVNCVVLRMNASTRACGPKGKWFEPKDAA